MSISIIDSNGVERFLGNIDPTASQKYSWRVFGDTPDQIMIPRSAWKQYITAFGNGFENRCMTPIHDQDGIGMCNASATAAAIEMMRSQIGLPYVSLSGGDLYRRICGGRDQGSMLEDGIREAMANGVAETNVVPYLDWRGAPAGWKESAKKHMVLEASLCPTFDHVASALLHGYPVIMGMMWSNNDNVDGDGWLPERAGGGGGHALCSYWLAERNGKFGAVTRNSWKESWGRNGICVIPESRFGRQVTGNWAVRVVSQADSDMPAPQE